MSEIDETAMQNNGAIQEYLAENGTLLNDLTDEVHSLKMKLQPVSSPKPSTPSDVRPGGELAETKEPGVKYVVNDIKNRNGRIIGLIQEVKNIKAQLDL